MKFDSSLPQERDRHERPFQEPRPAGAPRPAEAVDSPPGEAHELRSHRGHFEALSNKAYLNYGLMGPMPRPAIDAIRQSYDWVERTGPASAEIFAWYEREMDETRTALAEELQAPPETFVLTKSTSTGCNVVLWGIDWKPGDHLLLTDGEYPGIVAAAQLLQKRLGIEISECPLKETEDPRKAQGILERHLRPNTRLVVVSHVFWNTGSVAPISEIAELCRNHAAANGPVRVLVDGAQSVGVLPLNLDRLKADFYAFPAQKWWCGPEGLGGLYIRPRALESLKTPSVGCRGLLEKAAGRQGDHRRKMRRFEVIPSAPLNGGLRRVLALHREWGTQERRYGRIRRLTHYLWLRLRELSSGRARHRLFGLPDSVPQSGIVCFGISDVPSQELTWRLETRHFMVRAVPDPDRIRVCVHYLTLHAEIDQLIEAIQEFAPG